MKKKVCIQQPKPGSLMGPKNIEGTVLLLFNENVDRIDEIQRNEVALVVGGSLPAHFQKENEDAQVCIWLRVLSPRGIVGFILKAFSSEVT